MAERTHSTGSGRVWTGRDQRLLSIAIGNELVNRCRTEGRQWTALSADEARQRRYAIHLDFTTGKTAGDARAKLANLYRMLDAGRVPVLATTVPFATPDLTVAA